MKAKSKVGAPKGKAAKPHVPVESPRRAFYRNHQAHHMRRELGVRPGTDIRGRIIASMLPNSEREDRSGLNFLRDPEVIKYVKDRSAFVKANGGTIDEDRLWRNMLSSMPLCFNLFGRLRQHRAIAARTLQSLIGFEIASIELEVEWSEPLLGDKTAFDACAEYETPEGAKGFVGIETKYTEPFGRQKISNKNIDRYRAAARKICSKMPSDSDLTRQVWRNTLLAAAHRSARRFDHGCSLVVTLGDDREALRDVARVRSHLKDPSFLRWTSYEALIADLEETELRGWAKEFKARYLPNVPISA